MKVTYGTLSDAFATLGATTAVMAFQFLLLLVVASLFAIAVAIESSHGLWREQA